MFHMISDLNELYDILAEIDNWEGLCRNLQVDVAILDELRNSDGLTSDNKEKCLLTYFKMGNATWERVVEAVANYPISNTILAKQIAMKYEVNFD